MKVTQQYVEGIKEGRKLVTWWKRDNFYSRALVATEIESLRALRRKLASLANTRNEIEFFDGQIDFFDNHLKSL